MFNLVLNLQVEEDRNFSLLHFCHQQYTGDSQKLQHSSIALRKMLARHEAIHEIYRENDRQRREIVVLLNVLSATNYNCVRSSRSCTLFSLSRGSLLAQDRHEQNAGESSSTSLHERGTDAPWFSSSRRSSSDRRRTRMKLDKGRQKQAE